MNREMALARMEAFAPRMRDYGAKRNGVVPGHPHVSGLSPALRHRLLGEEELADFAIAQHGFKRVEKFVQEIYWRLYWKSWLEMRPAVWNRYREELIELPAGAWRACEKVMDGHSEIEVINHFARELNTTGYLHNHARMWLAAAWVHHFHLPWQIGAEWFHQQLLDGDPASNTLSWRWVAGLHTPGKTYLAGKSNLEKCLDPAILNAHRGGLELLDSPEPLLLNEETPIPLQDPKITEFPSDLEGPVGLWIHEDDLRPETLTDFDRLQPVAALALIPEDLHQAYGYSASRCEQIEIGITESASRLTRVPDTETKVSHQAAQDLADWAQAHQLKSVVAIQPWVGALRDSLPAIQTELKDRDIALHLHRRESDRWWLPLARSGFFSFWKKVCRHRKFPV